MKHALKITLFLLMFYIVAQVFGLWLVNQEMQVETVDGKQVTNYSDTALGPRPEMTGMETLVYILIGVGIGTLLILLIAKFKKINLWKFWFLLAAFLAMSLALGVVMSTTVAVVLAMGLALLKVFRPHIFVHNFTEVLMYAGIAVFFVPMFGDELGYAIALLLLFSVYDAYAVWKSKHMIKMAQFQSDSNLFAGISLPYDTRKVKIKTGEKVDMKPKAKTKKASTRTAILGGGDIALPMIFSGVVMQWLVSGGLAKSMALLYSFIIVLTSALALFALFMLSEKEKFYPAMPFLTAGCFIGLGIVYLL